METRWWVQWEQVMKMYSWRTFSSFSKDIDNILSHVLGAISKTTHKNSRWEKSATWWQTAPTTSAATILRTGLKEIRTNGPWNWRLLLLLSRFSRVRRSATPWTVVPLQAPLSMGFSRQGYWSGLSCSPPGYLPYPGIEPVSPALAGRFFTISAIGEALELKINCT